MINTVAAIAVWLTIVCGGAFFVFVSARLAYLALARLWTDTSLGDRMDQRIAALTCPTCRKRLDALLVEDVTTLCPKHQRWLEYIKRLEVEVGNITFDDVRRMADPELDVLLSREVFEAGRPCTCDSCTGKDVEGLSSYDVEDGTGRVVARYWVGKAKH